MRIAIAPAGTKTSAATIRALLDISSIGSDAIQIQAFYRDPAKAPAEFSAHADVQILRGDIEDASSLDFSGADAVLTSTPPVFDGRDLVANAQSVSRNVKDAIERAGCVQKLVLLSSVGAQFSEGVGEIKTNNVAEQVLSKTKVPQITFVRCAYFMENWALFCDGLRAPEPYFPSLITPLDWKVPMVAVRDIGRVLAGELASAEQRQRSPYVFELHGPEAYSPLDVQDAFSKAMGRRVNIEPVEQDKIHDFYAKIFPASIVGEWEEMARSFLPGSPVLEEMERQKADAVVVRGKDDLTSTLKEFV